jgi:polysaccharide biosynthesis protein PslG
MFLVNLIFQILIPIFMKPIIMNLKPIYALFCTVLIFSCTKKFNSDEENDNIKINAKASYNSTPYFADSNNVSSGACVQLAQANLTATNLNLVKNCNFKMIRTDFFWESVEITTKGQYDWTFYDNLENLLSSRGLRPFFTLNRNNTLYTTDWGNEIVGTVNVKAFAKFAKAAALRYNSLKPVWEIYNEPNLPGNWISTETKLQQAIDFTNLVKATSTAMRAAVSKITIIAPGLALDPVSGDPDYQYLEYCLQNGILDYVDGISIHPYSTVAPEVVSLDYYATTQNLINQYSDTRFVPVIEGETGYSYAPSWIYVTSLAVHADFIERQFLLNFSLSLPLSNYFNLFDYADIGDYSPVDQEWNFGLCKKNKVPKPAYKRVKTMLATLSGLKFIRSYATIEGDYKLEFSNGEKYVTAAWTTNNSHSNVIYGTSYVLNSKPKYIIKP